MLLKTQVYKLRSGRYQVSVYNRTTQNRKRINFKLLGEAEYYQRALVEQFSNNGIDGASVVSVSEWMQTYLKFNPDAFIKRQGKPMQESFAETFGHRPVMDIGRQDVSAWLVELKNVRKYSQRTMPNIKSAVNQFFQFLVDANAIRINPVIEIKVRKGEAKRERVILSESEIQDLLKELRSISPAIIFPVVFLLAHTGARLGEILNLTWSDVHFDLQALHFLRTKNSEDRLVHASAEVMNFLRELPRVSDHVTLSQYQKNWTRTQYRKQFNKIRGKLQLSKYWCNHVLRHSFAVNYLKQNGDMNQLQKILGHKSLKMTVDLYGHADAQDIKNPSPFDF